MLIHFKDDVVDEFDPGFKLGEFREINNSNKELEDIITGKSPETFVVINNRNEIEHLHYYFSDDNPLEEIELLKEVISGLPIKGSYTVPELNLEDVTFREVLEAVKNYYIQEEKRETILNFEDQIAGFILQAPDCDLDNDDNLDTEFTGMIGDNVFNNPKMEVVSYSLAFTVEPENILEVEISEIDDFKPRGKYTVPELGLEGVSFKEVLIAIRNYYLKKLPPRDE